MSMNYIESQVRLEDRESAYISTAAEKNLIEIFKKLDIYDYGKISKQELEKQLVKKEISIQHTIESNINNEIEFKVFLKKKLYAEFKIPLEIATHHIFLNHTNIKYYE